MDTNLNRQQAIEKIAAGIANASQFPPKLAAALWGEDTLPLAVAAVDALGLWPEADPDLEERDGEGFTAAERAESLERAERAYGTLPTPEQVARSKGAARAPAES